MIFWITCFALSFIALEGLVFLLFPDLLKELIAEADPKMLMFAGLLESLVGAVLLYLHLVCR